MTAVPHSWFTTYTECNNFKLTLLKFWILCLHILPLLGLKLSMCNLAKAKDPRYLHSNYTAWGEPPFSPSCSGPEHCNRSSPWPLHSLHLLSTTSSTLEWHPVLPGMGKVSQMQEGTNAHPLLPCPLHGESPLDRGDSARQKRPPEKGSKP